MRQETRCDPYTRSNLKCGISRHTLRCPRARQGHDPAVPDLADAVDFAVLPPHTTDVLAQPFVTPHPGRPAVGDSTPAP